MTVKLVVVIEDEIVLPLIGNCERNSLDVRLEFVECRARLVQQEFRLEIDKKSIGTYTSYDVQIWMVSLLA